MIARSLGIVTTYMIQLVFDSSRGQLVKLFSWRVDDGEGIRGAIRVVAEILGTVREVCFELLWGFYHLHLYRARLRSEKKSRRRVGRTECITDRVYAKNCAGQTPRYN